MTADIELVRLAFVMGIAVSLLFYERWNLTTGSVVVPGYLAALFLRPSSALMTVLIALLCHQLINRMLAGRISLYGRTKFVVLALTSILLTTIAGLLWVQSGPPDEWGTFAESAGYIVPALIAHDMGRQGVARTTKAVVLSSGAVLVALIAAMLITPATANPAYGATQALGFEQGALPLAVLVSACCAWSLQSRFGMRAGGFVGGAYIALLVNDWQAILGLLAVALVTYVVVAKVLAEVAILFGRRKFSAMLLFGGLLGWWAVTSFAELAPSMPMDFGVLAGFAIAPMLLPALIANDMERAGIVNVAVGLTTSALVVLGTLRLADLGVPVLPPSVIGPVLAILVVGIAVVVANYPADEQRPVDARPSVMTNRSWRRSPTSGLTRTS